MDGLSSPCYPTPSPNAVAISLGFPSEVTCLILVQEKRPGPFLRQPSPVLPLSCTFPEVLSPIRSRKAGVLVRAWDSSRFRLKIHVHLTRYLIILILFFFLERPGAIWPTLSYSGGLARPFFRPNGSYTDTTSRGKIFSGRSLRSMVLAPQHPFSVL